MSDVIPSLGLVSARREAASPGSDGETTEARQTSDRLEDIESVSRLLQDDRRALELLLDETTGRLLIRVLDRRHRTLIRQIWLDQVSKLILTKRL